MMSHELQGVLQIFLKKVIHPQLFMRTAQNEITTTFLRKKGVKRLLCS